VQKYQCALVRLELLAEIARLRDAGSPVWETIAFSNQEAALLCTSKLAGENYSFAGKTEGC
jgi:hypothetical protein